MHFLLNVLKKDSIFVDIGAGIGDYSILASHIIKSGKIIAFEPGQEPRRYFEENIRLNRLDNITLSSKVVSDKSGSIAFVEKKVSEISHIKPLQPKNGMYLSTTIDDLFTAYDLSHIDVVKIDVEGAESLVLKGSRSALRSGKIKVFILELNKKSVQYGSSHKEVMSIFKENQYEVFRICDGKLLKLEDKSEVRTYNVICIHSRHLDSFKNRYYRNEHTN